MLAAWLIAKAFAPRYAIVATLLVGGIVAWAGGDVVTDKITFRLLCRNLLPPHLPLPAWSASACRFSW
jgi:benzoate membrane transport protein